MMRPSVLVGPALASVFIIATITGAAAQPKGPIVDANIGAVCLRIMHIPKIDIADFQGCVASLSASFASSGGYAGPNDEDYCKTKGLAPHTAAMATCILDRQYQTTRASDVDRMEARIEKVASSDTDKESYFGTPPSVTARREQYACAQLGLDPSTVTFHSCVSSLDSTLYAIDHPVGGD